MNKPVYYFSVFVAGGVLYGLIELSFRGMTHWTMLCAGGLCTLLVSLISVKIRAALWQKWILGGAVITTVEFVAGALINLRFGLGVWDYSHQPLDFMGQICPLFSAIWVLLSIPVVFVSGRLHNRVFGREDDAA